MKEIDINDVEKISSDLNDYLAVYEKIAAKSLNSFTKDLDMKVSEVDGYIKRCKSMGLDYDMPTLERFLTELSSVIYFTTEKYEKVGFLSDMAETNRDSTYNQAYLRKQGSYDAGTKFSVQQLKSYAAEVALNDDIVMRIYKHAYSVIKSKLDAADKLYKAVSKIYSGAIESFKRGV